MQYEPQTPRRTSEAAPSCSRCGARQNPAAKFCRSCGASVGDAPPPLAEPHRERLVSVPQQVAPSEFPPLRDERRWPGRHIPLAFVEDDLDDRPPQPSKLMDIDYLDAQLGLKAPGSEDAPPPKPPAWRLRGRLGSVGNETDVPREVRAVPVPDSREPVEPREAQRSREEREPRQSGEARLGSTHASPSPWVPWAIAFAVIALASAVLAHALAPIALTGYSTPELDVTVRMRALEWLLAGNLVAMVGLLLKR